MLVYLEVSPLMASTRNGYNLSVEVYNLEQCAVKDGHLPIAWDFVERILGNED